jgi:hypothetical protein
MAAKLLKLLEGVLSIFSKLPLKSLNNQADFDSAIRRFDPSRPSQQRGRVKRLVKHEAARQTKRPPEGGLSVALIEIEIRLRPARRSVSPRHLIKGRW